MNKREFGLVLKVDGDISNILSSLKNLQGSLNNVEMPKGLTKDLEKDILNAIQKIGEFDKRSQQAINSVEDSKEVSKQWESITKMLTSLQVKLEGIKSTDIFPKEVTANIEAMKASAKEYLQVLENAKQSDAFKNKVAELEQVEEKQKILNSELKKANQALVKAETDYNIQKEQWSEETNAQYEKEQAEIAKTSQAYKDQLQVINDLRAARESLKSEGYLTSDGTLTKDKRNQLEQLAAAEETEASKRRSLSSYNGKVKKYEKEHAGIDLKNDQAYLALKKKQANAENEHKKALEDLKKIKKEIGNVDKLKSAATNKQELAAANNASKDLKGMADAAKEAGAALEEQKNALDQAETNYQEASQKVAGYKNELDKLDTASENLNTDLKKIQTDSAEKEWQALVDKVKELTGIDISGSAHDMQAFTKAIEDYEAGQIENLPNVLEEILKNTKPIAPAMENIKEGVDDVGDSVKDLAQADREIENLKNQVKDFFSISNSIQLFKRAISSAMNTVKELDATMTEAAVVTDFSIGDMWDKLPEYSAQAKGLGVSINSMYQATTLYLQQGLKFQGAMELGIETMKMAKIAGMDSAEATKAMTSALRGFNMELNETSATRVNDVYSQLAAVTAADAGQIATAMEKTASIAASANMELETTAAFLSQIIETTQEAPETAGTALKTIIARFAEVKSLREQNLDYGEDEEGEGIDVNKIQAALRSVGISMEGFFQGTEGLDSILLKLSEKWGTLDFETQRYIATMAAGSRQQSRFIAMMSDYGRTTELVAEANNSAGASQKQYEKTLDSLETKLQNLKNAWDEFVMGLANNELLKGGVDLLTNLLETINKLTAGLSGGNGLVKSLASLITVISGLKVGRTLFGETGKQGIGMLGGLLGVKKPKSEAQNKTGASKEQPKDIVNTKKAKKTYTKTVQSSSVNKQRLLERMDGATGKDDKTTNKMKALREEVEKGEISADKAAKKFKKLGGNIEGLEEPSQKSRVDLDAVASTMGNVGMATMGVGAAMGLLAGIFESLGMEAAAEALQEIGSVLIGVGSAITMLSSLIPVLTSLSAVAWSTILPILGIVAALTALAVIIGVIAQARYNGSLEGRMKAAAEATERARAAAEDAKEAYNDLLSSKSEYSDLQTQLDSLTKGTLEWKQALVESNNQVLQLLNTYPELAKYLKRGESGQLTISEEGWNALIEQQSQGVTNANSALIASQMDQTNLQNEAAKKQLESNDIYNAVLSTLQYSEQEEALEALKRGQDSEQLWEVVKTLDYGEKEIEELKEAILTYNEALKQNEIALQAQSEALLANNVSEEISGHEFGDQFLSGIAAGFVKTQTSKETLISSLFTHAVGPIKELDRFKTIAVDAGVDFNALTGDNVNDLEVLYAKIAGITTDQIGEGLKGNVGMLSKEIAKIQVAKEAGMTTEQIFSHFENLDRPTQQKYSTLMSGDLSNATMDLVAEFKEINDKETGDKKLAIMATRLGFKDIKGMAEAFGQSTDTIGAHFENIAKSAGKEFAEVSHAIKKLDLGKNLSDALGNATLEQSKKILSIFEYSMDEGAKNTILTGFETLLQSTTDIQKDQILSLAATYDWMRQGAGEDFVKQLERLGFITEENKGALEGFIEEMGLVNAFYRDFDVVSITEKLKNGFQEAEDILTQNELSAEQLKKYYEDGLLDTLEGWTFNGEGWVNIESGMEGLSKALYDNTKQIFENNKLEAKRQIALYDSANEAIKNHQGVYTYRDEYGEWYESSTKLTNKEMREQGLTFERQEQTYDIEFMATGKAGVGAWSQFFNSAQEYQEWVKLYNGDIEWARIWERSELEEFSAAAKKEKEYDPYEKYYNIYQRLSAIAKQKERLEKIHNKLLEEGNNQQAIENKNKKRAILEENKEKYADLALKKRAQINEQLNTKDAAQRKVINASKLSVSEDGAISFDVEYVNNQMSDAQREIFDELLNTITELRDQEWEAQDLSLDAEIEIYEQNKQDLEDYVNFASEIKDALIQERQKEIDKLSEINDTINETNSKILESMQEQIAEARQARENEKTEQELSDKQRRLAYLQQDTSGANALEIMQLQKEIEEGQESYTDQLIDQKISELQKQNDKAAEQRERQIKIMEAQLKIYEQGAIWKDVSKLFEEGFNADGSLNENSELVRILREKAGYNYMSDSEKEQFDTNLKTSSGAAFTAVSTAKPAEGERIIFTTSSGEEKVGIGNKDGTVEADGQSYRVRKNSNNRWTQYKTGGLADFTGPAWLDGTKSKPEYILNADQTKAFFALVDILGDFKLGEAKTTQNSGDSIYDIDINVESIGSDYDVEQVAEKVRELIVNGSRYRNNNTL